MADMKNDLSNSNTSTDKEATNATNQVSNKVQSAGAPGSAGMVGSKRWMKANMGKEENNSSQKQ